MDATTVIFFRTPVYYTSCLRHIGGGGGGGGHVHFQAGVSTLTQVTGDICSLGSVCLVEDSALFVSSVCVVMNVLVAITVST